MRVVLLNQFFAPAEAATAQLLGDLACGLVSAGHEVTVICSRRSYPDPLPIRVRRETLDGVDVRRAWSTGFGRGTRLGRMLDYATFALGAAWTLLRTPRPDVVVALTTPPLIAALAVFISGFRRSRVLYWVMDVYPDLAFRLGVLREATPTARLLGRLNRYALLGSERVVALGETMAGELGRRGVDRVDVVHNWADGEAIRGIGLRGHPLRAERGWNEKFVVLYSGNLGLAHEFDTVLDAAEILAEDGRIAFAFVGSGPRRDAVEAAVTRRGLRNVSFYPYEARESLGLSLTAGDVHLITLRPGLSGLLVPSKIYGVLAAARPTIYVGPPDTEIPAILAEGGCGSALAPGDPAALAERIREYARDPGRCDVEGRRGRELFERRFARPLGVGRLVELIETTGKDR